jgi:gas vesicle protein
MSENHAENGFLSAFLAGALVGAGIALLFAPRSGKDTRDMLSDKALGLKEKAQDAFAKGKAVVREQAEAALSEHGVKKTV